MTTIGRPTCTYMCMYMYNVVISYLHVHVVTIVILTIGTECLSGNVVEPSLVPRPHPLFNVTRSNIEKWVWPGDEAGGTTDKGHSVLRTNTNRKLYVHC